MNHNRFPALALKKHLRFFNSTQMGKERFKMRSSF